MAVHNLDLSPQDSDGVSDTWEYSSYRLLSPDEKQIKFVQNNAGIVLLHPEQVGLSPGNSVAIEQFDVHTIERLLPHVSGRRFEQHLNRLFAGLQK
jgi:hypothetical protein